jgi:choline dehydrogenase-like flavoprotein
MNSPSPANAKGVYNTPLNMDKYKRSSPRDFLVNTAASLASRSGRGKIDIRTRSLATKVIFQSGTTRAIGVEFRDGQSLYRADPRAAGTGTGSTGTAYANKEVIVAGGAFNTPQLLKLSGVGPAQELKALKIPVVVDLPGVGENLQDRYENSIVVNLTKPLAIWTVSHQAHQHCTKLGANSCRIAQTVPTHPILVSKSGIPFNPTNPAMRPTAAQFLSPNVRLAP